MKICPIYLVNKFLYVLPSKLFEYGEKNFVAKFVEDVKSSIIYRLENLSDVDVKILDKNLSNDLIMTMRLYTKVTEPKASAELVETIQLKVAAKLLKCPFLEKRVRGINEFKDILDKVRNSERHHKSYLEANGIEHSQWLTFERLIKWILDEKIIEFIFG
jgi:hypothetical protein